MSMAPNLAPDRCRFCRTEVVEVRADGSGMGWCHDHRWAWPIAHVPYDERPGAPAARPHVVAMWRAAIVAAAVRRGEAIVSPELEEPVALAMACGLVEGHGREAAVIWAEDASDERVSRAEAAFRSWWEARERRSAESVTDGEAESLQRAVVAALPGGRA